MDVRVRYFAGAAAAAGTEEETVSLPAGATLADLVDVVGLVGSARGEHLRRVLAACTFLRDGVGADRTRTLSDGTVVDVLPPFAGG